MTGKKKYLKEKMDSQTNSNSTSATTTTKKREEKRSDEVSSAKETKEKRQTREQYTKDFPELSDNNSQKQANSSTKRKPRTLKSESDMSDDE